MSDEHNDSTGEDEMTTAQLDGMRGLWVDATGPERTKTARDMALTPHNLNRTGDRATTADGRKWYWVVARSLWIS
jgi:hypothetical protein